MASSCAMDSLLYKDFEKHSVAIIEDSTGIFLNIKDGRRILDATSGAAVACLGYRNLEVQEAMIQQISKTSYCHPGFYKSQCAEDLAKLLADSTNGHMTKVLLCGSGSEGVEVAVKLASTYFSNINAAERTTFISRIGAWHGATLGALALGDFKTRKDPFLPLIPQIASRVSACSTYRGMRKGETDQSFVRRLAQELDEEILRIGSHKVCAFVAETVGGSASGCAVPVRGYFAAMKAVCEKHGALLILDEVMCGMGRTGTLHAWEQEGVVPDIQIVGKGLGSGFCSISAVLVNSWLVKSFQEHGRPFAHGQTYMSHPLAAAAALKVQTIIQRDNWIANVREMGAYLGKKLQETLMHHPHIGDIRGRGLFWAVEFVADKESKVPFPTKMNLNGLLHERGMSKGYEIALFNASGTYDGYAGDHILICPPYIVTRVEIDEIVRRLMSVIEDCFSDLKALAAWKSLIIS